MKKAIKTLLLILIVQTGFSQHAGIQFKEAKNWTQIQEIAKRENKYIFLDCYATWCGPCKMMDEQVYNQKEVGEVLNKQFISVKVQFDQTERDNDYVKNWYEDVKGLSEKYMVNAFPTLMFFTPEGNLVHRIIGFQGTEEFIKSVNYAIDPKRKQYYVLMEAYTKGQKDYTVVPDLIKTTREILRDRQLATQMAKDYKYNYLDHLPAEKILTKDNLELLRHYNQFLASKDMVFEIAVNDPGKIETVWPGWAKSVSEYIISREELNNKLMSKDSSYPQKKPKWSQFITNIQKKYPSVDAGKMVQEFKIFYYLGYHKDWKLWADAMDEKLKLITPNLSDPFETIFIPFNTDGAWRAFMGCNDYKVLKRSLDWIDVAIDISPDSFEYKSMYLDTKAAVLYKMGKVEEAIEMEEMAVTLAESKLKNAVDGYKDVLDQMRRREPIYLDERANWDEKSLARIKR